MMKAMSRRPAPVLMGFCLCLGFILPAVAQDDGDPPVGLPVATEDESELLIQILGREGVGPEHLEHQCEDADGRPVRFVTDK